MLAKSITNALLCQIYLVAVANADFTDRLQENRDDAQRCRCQVEEAIKLVCEELYKAFAINCRDLSDLCDGDLLIADIHARRSIGLNNLGLISDRNLEAVFACEGVLAIAIFQDGTPLLWEIFFHKLYLP